MDTETDKIAIEWLLLDAWRNHETEKLSALVPCDIPEVMETNRFTADTVC